MSAPPISPTAAHVENLLVLCAVTFDERGHSKSWKNALARDLNQITGRVQWTLETDGCDVDVAFAEAALRIVARVADSVVLKLALKP